jgi:hypothetical protein
VKIENTQVFGFGAALRGMRNAFSSWDKSDTVFDNDSIIVLGQSDTKLINNLIKAGSSHRKFLRQICIWVDFTLPRYVWQEFDTYKIGTVKNSCSTMHTIGKRHLTPDDFECREILPASLEHINELITAYNSRKDVQTLLRIKRALPDGFLQRATVTLNYEIAMNMMMQRHTHRLPEWSEGICEWIVSLPQMYDWLIAAGMENM